MCENTRTKVKRTAIRCNGRLSVALRLFYTLDQASKKRYTQKIAIFNSEYPYWLKKDTFSQLEDDLPEFM